ncbi:adenylyltransferase/cytidyltransferase family protein [Rhizobacter sp. LjRoot28]|uniref:adenylyltransferase/cytidyltransferase family protein n=1 Tax=Rhizobacter sp. LjRoot28 TaxID=3342309 RepID=UPI003ECD0973
MRAAALGPAAVELRQGALPRETLVKESSTVAITYGTYDLFHMGHVNLFRRIKERYDILVVAVSTDEFNAIKGKRSAVSFADRLALVQACRYVDLAIPESDWGQKEVDILRFRADAMVMGSDWAGHFDELKSLCDVVYLPRTEGVSSTELKAQIQSFAR